MDSEGLQIFACSTGLHGSKRLYSMIYVLVLNHRNTYTALNALAGHFNSYGLSQPLPKKRLERIQKELDDATKMLARGR